MRSSGAWQLQEPLGDIHTQLANPTVQPNPGAYLDKFSLDDFLQKLGAAMGGGTWTKTFNPATEQYVFDFRYLLTPVWTNYKQIQAVGTIGVVADSSAMAASAPINVQQHAGKTMTYTRPMLTSTTSEAGLCFYDENNEAISAERVGLGAESNEYELTQIQIPANAVSVRFSTRVDMKTEFQAYVLPQ